MKVLVSFCGYFDKYLGDDRRWLGLIEGDPAGDLSFRLLPTPPTKIIGDPHLGGLGLALWNGKVISALQWNQPAFVVFDAATMAFERAVAVEEVADVHSIAVHGNILHVASTGNNSVVALSLPTFDLASEPLRFGPIEQNMIHLNSVAVTQDGHVVIAYHDEPLAPEAKAVIRDIGASPAAMDLETEVRRLHSLTIGPGGILAYCDSLKNRAWIGFRWLRTAGYARGLAFRDGYIVAGSSRLRGDGPGPAVCAVEVFDRDGLVLNSVDINERWEIYDILILED